MICLRIGVLRHSHCHCLHFMHFSWFYPHIVVEIGINVPVERGCVLYSVYSLTAWSIAEFYCMEVAWGGGGGWNLSTSTRPTLCVDNAYFQRSLPEVTSQVEVEWCIYVFIAVKGFIQHDVAQRSWVIYSQWKWPAGQCRSRFCVQPHTEVWCILCGYVHMGRPTSIMYIY